MVAQSKLRILLVEDVPEDAELIQHALRKAGIAFVVKVVQTEAQFIQELEAFHPEIVLSDYSLPEFNGRAALDIVRQRYRTVPMVMVTGALGDEEAVGLIKAGARDYVLKDRLARLAPAIRRAIAEEQELRHREEAEQALQASELRYRRLFEAAYDGILIIDSLSQKINGANHFIQGLLGYPRDELMGKELWEIGVLGDVSECQRLFLNLRERGHVHYEHLPIHSKWGDELEVEFVSNIHQVGERAVVQCNVRDITERCRLARQASEQAAMLADLHRRKDEFLAMLSHEIRNPLAAILSAAHLLRLNKDETRIQEQARTVIERQIGQLSRLVTDLMGVSRLTSGRIHVSPERVDLNTVVKHAIETVQQCIEQRRHVLSVTLPKEPLWAGVDPGRIEQVVANLLENASKYTDEGGHIEVTLNQQGRNAVLSVRDNGMGMPADLLPYVFDLFTQGHRGLGRTEGGLGIGLTLVKRIVELHNGTVEAKSAGTGLGSQFVVHLPVLLASKPVEHNPPPRAVRCENLRILVVDDNVDAAEPLALLLIAQGHITRTVHSGEAALQAAVEFRPDIVLLDIGLPDLNGYEVAERLRRQPQLKSTRIIAITGYGQEADRAKSKAAGFEDHLVKPIDHAELYALLG